MIKIINIGSHKTGTCSLIEALRILGYSHSPEWFYSDEETHFNNIIKNENGIKDLCNYITDTEFNLYEDSPYNYKEIYKELYNYNNDFKFILTIREENSWFKSLLQSTQRIPEENLKNNIQLQYLYGDVEEINQDKIINIYNERNNKIIDFLKEKQNLCVIHLNDDDDIVKWQKLTTFLGIPDKFELVKNLKYPYENKTIYTSH